MSPKVIHAALPIDSFPSCMHDPDTNRYHAIPLLLSREAQDIYATVGLELTTCPFEIGKTIARKLGAESERRTNLKCSAWRKIQATENKSFSKKTVEVRKGKRGRITKSEAHKLHDRLVTYATSVPRFITDPDVRFTNNPGERKIHMAKVKQKVLGCFRTHHSAQAVVYHLKQEIPFLSEA